MPFWDADKLPPVQSCVLGRGESCEMVAASPGYAQGEHRVWNAVVKLAVPAK